MIEHQGRGSPTNLPSGLRAGRPAYATALGRTDSTAGWRENKRDGDEGYHGPGTGCGVILARSFCDAGEERQNQRPGIATKQNGPEPYDSGPRCWSARVCGHEGGQGMCAGRPGGRGGTLPCFGPPTGAAGDLTVGSLPLV